MRPSALLLGTAIASMASLGACSSSPPALHDFNTMTATRISPLMTRKDVSGDKTSLAIYDLRKGARVPVHYHDSEQLTYVLTGRLRVVVEGQSFTVGPGQVLSIPAYAQHSMEALENTVEYDVFSPVRWSWKEDQEDSQRR